MLDVRSHSNTVIANEPYLRSEVVKHNNSGMFPVADSPGHAV